MTEGTLRTREHVTGRCFQDGLSVALLACSLWLHAQAPDNIPQTLVRIHGSVVNAVTHAPIPRALVTSADQRMAVMTDEKGRFEFDVNLAAANSRNPDFRGEVQTPYIVVRKPGYLASALPTLLPLDDLAALKADQRLQLMPEASISGSAVGATEDVPGGLNVQLLHRQMQDGMPSWTQFQNQQVDARGRFHFGGLTPGDYKIVTAEWVDQAGPMVASANKPVAGYPPQYYPSGSSGATAAILHLGGGQNAVADLNLRGAKYYQVEIPVSGSAPAKSVQVQVASENGPGYSLGFNQKSQKVEGMLPDGVYHITVVDIDTGDVTKPRAIAEIRAGTGNLTVEGKAVHGTGIALLPAATIAVNVREDFTGTDPSATDTVVKLAGIVPAPALSGIADAGNPVPLIVPRAVEAFLGPADPGFAGSNFGNIGFAPALQPDPNTGELKFNGVPPGRYRVQVNPRRGYVASATANGVDLLRDPLVVESGAGSSAISIILRDDSGTITGTVSETAGRPSVSNYVIAFPLNEERSAQPVFGNLQLDGKFTLSNVVPGRYLVVAGEGRPPSLEYRNKDAMKTHESQGAVVDVTAGQSVTTSVKLLPSACDYGDDSDEVDD